MAYEKNDCMKKPSEKVLKKTVIQWTYIRTSCVNAFIKLLDLCKQIKCVLLYAHGRLPIDRCIRKSATFNKDHCKLQKRSVPSWNSSQCTLYNCDFSNYRNIVTFIELCKTYKRMSVCAYKSTASREISR